MLLSQVGAQLYTVRGHLGSVEQIAETLDRIRTIGYGLVELIDLSAVIPDQELKLLLVANGLTACAMHFPSADILNEPQKIIERMHTLGINIAVYPYPRDQNLSSQADEFVASLNRAVSLFREARKDIAYHNHHIEFMKIDRGQLILDLIFSQTSLPLSFELDAYWVQYGGGDIVQWIRKLRNRLGVLHLKDYAIMPDPAGKFVPVFAEVGSGNLDWKRIIQAADEVGCQYYIVEQDECPGDPFDSLETSYNYIAQHLVRRTRP